MNISPRSRFAGIGRSLVCSQEFIVAVLAAVLLGGAAAFVPGFLTIGNLIGLVESVTILGLLGLAMGIVIIARGIDLSLIAVMACPSAFILQMVANGWSIGVAFLVGAMSAVTCGFLNGWLIAYADLPALFVTLASGLALYGIATTCLSNDIVEWPSSLDNWAWIGRSHPGGIPMPIIVFAILMALAAVLLKKTNIGRFLYAMGDNPLSAKAIGIPTQRITILIYLLSALIAFVAGLIMAAMLHASAVRIYNSTMLYQVILVVVLGGIALSGGRGGALSIILGTITIGIITNVMTLLNVSDPTQNLAKGALLLTAILIDSQLNPRNEETAQQGDI
jgi:ribose transport system permease protein